MSCGIVDTFVGALYVLFLKSFMTESFVQSPGIRTDGAVGADNLKAELPADPTIRSSRTPNFKASPGHVSMQTGARPFCTLFRHMSHFCMVPLSPYRGT